jgi:hypothetical protein
MLGGLENGRNRFVRRRLLQFLGAGERSHKKQRPKRIRTGLRPSPRAHVVPAVTQSGYSTQPRMPARSRNPYDATRRKIERQGTPTDASRWCHIRSQQSKIRSLWRDGRGHETYLIGKHATCLLAGSVGGALRYAKPQRGGSDGGGESVGGLELSPYRANGENAQRVCIGLIAVKRPSLPSLRRTPARRAAQILT